MNEKSTMLIVSVTPYKEADGLIVAITPTYGVLSLIAKGLFKPTAKHIGLIQPLATVEALFDYKKGLSLFKSATNLTLYPSFTSDLLALSVATMIVQVVAKNSQQQLLVPFDWLIEVLSKLTKTNPISYLFYFLVQCSYLQGLSLQVDYCVICKDQHVYALSVSAGGFLCHSCAKSHDHNLYSIDFYKALRCAYKADLNQFDQCIATYDYTYDHVAIMIDLMEETLVIPRKNWHFILEL